MSELDDLAFAPPSEEVPLEIVNPRELRARVGDRLTAVAARVSFHVVIFCTGGEGLHEVDFAPVTLRPGRVVHVTPGQVHRWRLAREYEASVLLFDDSAAAIPSERAAVGPRWRDLARDRRDEAAQLLSLVSEAMDTDLVPTRRDRLLRGALQVLIVLLELDVDRQSGDTQMPRAYSDLVNQLETEPGWSRSVTERANDLGFSPRTLTRACQAAVGRSAKAVIDQRVILEARRLLVAPEATVEATADALGFSEVGNFAKFFRRLAGETPHTWRSRHRPLHE